MNKWVYDNGNCCVSLGPDGTKIREWPDGKVPYVDFPESVDMKITNRCYHGCVFCHENSTPDGEHADVDRIIKATRDLHSGVEIAIGGGNPLEHPEIEQILEMLSNCGLVCNITVNGEDFWDVHEKLHLYQYRGWLHGVGISPSKLGVLIPDNFQHAVIHLIAGIHSPEEAINHLGYHNVLVLGYKKHGRGINPPDSVQRNLDEWIFKAGRLLQQTGTGKLSFDNLALEQLHIHDIISPELWEARYMGGDGEFTMYFDAVCNEYAVSSISERFPAQEMTIPQMFKRLQVINQ